MSWIDTLKFDANGLIPVILQDAATGQVLTLAYMNREALEKTLETGNTWFWRRSHQKLMMKGETSGRVQRVKALLTDCDRDALLLQIEQVGEAACHTGHRSCFFWRLEEEELVETEPPLFDPREVYGSSG